MKKEERLATLEDMIYNYTELVCPERQLEEIFKFCVENSRSPKLTEGTCRCSTKECTKKIPDPKPKSQFVPGDIVYHKLTKGKFIYLQDLGGNLSQVFHLSSETKKTENTSNLCYQLEKKQTVLPATELIAVLEANGYKFVDRGCTCGWIHDKWGWGFDAKMFAFCGKDPGGHFNWRPEWIISK